MSIEILNNKTYARLLFLVILASLSYIFETQFARVLSNFGCMLVYNQVYQEKKTYVATFIQINYSEENVIKMVFVMLIELIFYYGLPVFIVLIGFKYAAAHIVFAIFLGIISELKSYFE